MGNAKSGFASMDPERQREIASLGGRAAQASGRGHQFTSESARVAGRKGGRTRKGQKTHGAQETGGPTPNPVQTFDPQGD